MNTQERYEKFRKLGMHRTVTQMCGVVVVFIVAMLLYDFLVNKNRGLTFIYLPVGLIVIAMVIATINNLQRFTLNPYYLSLLIIITVVPGISLMDYFNPFMLTSSLPTIIIMILFWGVLLPLTFPESIVLFLLAWISYVSSFFIHINDYNMTTISNNTIFIFISCILAAIWSINNYKQRKKVWILQQSGASEKPELCYQNTEKMQDQESQIRQAERAAFINQVISSLVHDLNNFLTIILGKNHLIYDSLPEGDINRNHIETVTKTCEKASALIRKLLAVSNNQICMPGKINLNETINEVKDMVTHTISRNIDLIIKKDPQLHPVKVDPLEIEQILLNLCINARDAMPNGGKLILETRNVSLDEIYCTSRNLSLEPGEYVMIAIGDTGTGISKKIRSQIFKPFFTTKDKDSGTGLGLSSVHRIIKQSKGDIIVYTEEGKGTVFKIFFPAYTQLPKNKYETKKSYNFNSIPKRLENKETILVVDDNESILHMTSCILRNHGFNVLEAKTSEQALSLVNKFNSKIDLMLSDVVLPDVSGKILYDKVKKICPSMGILFTSGFTSYLLQHYDLLDNSKDLIQKPFTTGELITKINDSLKKRQESNDVKFDYLFNRAVSNRSYFSTRQ